MCLWYECCGGAWRPGNTCSVPKCLQQSWFRHIELLVSLEKSILFFRRNVIEGWVRDIAAVGTCHVFYFLLCRNTYWLSSSSFWTISFLCWLPSKQHYRNMLIPVIHILFPLLMLHNFEDFELNYSFSIPDDTWSLSHFRTSLKVMFPSVNLPSFVCIDLGCQWLTNEQTN